jgi:SAM-dependent methyltransferase
MHEIVKDYYGTQLQSSSDLRTTACCDFTAVPEWMKAALSKIHDEVLSRYYGCGLVVPQLLAGCRVLDLGCGSGRDVYALSQLVGEHGSVVGVDMTPEQLAVAEKHQEYHRTAFGYAKSNVEFKLGYIENLNELGLPDHSFDVVVSNCVINLSPDKDAVLKEVHRLLKKGGEFYFSDVYSSRRVPDRVKNDPLLYGECLGGALYGNDFIDLAKRHGFADPRMVERHPIEITDPKLRERAEGIEFYSATYRLFKLDALESNCEDYGQAVIYQGTIPHHPHYFDLDDHHRIETGRVFPVCGNTWAMLHDTRMREHFRFIGDFSHHFGLFDCATPAPVSSGATTPGACC